VGVREIRREEWGERNGVRGMGHGNGVREMRNGNRYGVIQHIRHVRQ
jgi:hypothetical protein